MPLGIGSGLWAIVQPMDETNVNPNPSFEFGTSGVVTLQAAALGTSSGFQKYGAWSLAVTPNSNGTSGAYMGSWTSGNGTAYSVGAWINADNGVPMIMAIGSNNGLGLTSGSVTFTGGGTWQYYSCSLVEAAQGTRSVVVRKTSGASVAPFYVDGVKVSPWGDGVDRTTTYFDGDTGGGAWTGAQHASASTRTGQYRGGGSIIALADLGLQVDQMLGVGMPPVENSSQSYAVVDGAQFQRTRAGARHFTLTAKPIVGTSLGDFHVTRRTLIDAFKPDLVGQQQPVRLMYYGGQGTVQIDAYYDKGLELGNMDGPIAENAAISFASYDPYWYAPTQQGTTLGPRVALGSVNFIARRSALGAWGTLGSNGTTIGPSAQVPVAIRTLDILPSGTIVFGGGFGTVGGTLSPNIGMYFPQINTFGTLIGGTIPYAGGPILALAHNPAGTIFFGGQLASVAGTTTNHIGRHFNNAFGTLVGGTVSTANYLNALLYSPSGTLFVGGDFTSVAGTTSRSLAIWTGAAFGTLTGGTIQAAGGPNGLIRSFAVGADGRLFFAGNFDLIAGTPGTAVGQWNGAFGTLQNPLVYLGVEGFVNAVAIGPNGNLYQTGNVDTIASGTARGAFAWNGVSQRGLGAGLAFSPGGVGYGTSVDGWSIIPDGTTGRVYFGGAFNQVGSINVSACYALWNGYAYTLPDIAGPGFNTGTVYAMLQAPNGDLYIAGTFAGTAVAATVGTIVNTGRAAAYPTLRIRNTGAGTARIYQVLNTLTNDNVYFNYKMLGNEQATLNFTPGTRSFQSDFRGNIFNTIVPGSNLATWRLLPGTNYVSFFSDSDSVEAALYWTPRSWSIDGGTV